MKIRDLDPGFHLAFPTGMTQPWTITIDSPITVGELQEQWRREAGQYVFVSVWNLRASLVCYTAAPDGTGRMEPLDWPEEKYGFLARSVEEAGGYLNMSGWYPPSPELIAEVEAMTGRGEIGICQRCGEKAVKLGTYPTQGKGTMQRWRCSNGHTYSTIKHKKRLEK